MSKVVLKSNLKDITIDHKNNMTVSFSVPAVNRFKFEQIATELQNLDQEAKNGLKITIDKFRTKRTLTQNDTIWLLCEELAKVFHSTKEEVYRNYILQVGRFEIIPIRDDAVDFFVQVWEGRGLGWQCVNIRDSKIEDYKNVDCYYGTSVYDTKEMARVLEEVIKDCKEHNIEWQSYLDKSYKESDL